MSLEDTKIFINSLQEDFSILTQKEKMQCMIEFGKELEIFPEEEKVKANLVPGCMSEVYITCEYIDGKINFEGFADALIIKGYVCILKKAFSNMKKEVFLKESESMIDYFIEHTNIQFSQIQSRSNAFKNIYRLMKLKVESLEV